MLHPKIVGPLGFEPGLTEPKSVALPTELKER